MLAELCVDIPFIFFSTDLVFDGEKGNYIETDPVNPLSIYAETKVAAELSVMANPRHTVVRTSLNFGISPGRDRAFNEELRAAWKAGRVLNLFEDEYRSPIPVQATARAVWELLQTGQGGMFHLAGSERLSRYDIGMLLAQRCAELSPRFEKSSLRDYNGAPRSPDTSMNCDKLQALLKFKLPGLTQWLEERPLEPI
jgi:dTDP-4-dehydrorhamnose reductase